MPQPIQYTAAGIDLSPRIYTDTSVDASPAAAAETIIATVTCTADIAAVAGIELVGWCSVTIGASGTTSTLRLRRTNAAGTAVATSGAFTTAAAGVFDLPIMGFDTGPTLPGQVYVLTLTVANAAATSTVGAVYLRALVV